MGILYSISKTIYGDNTFDKLPDLLESNHPVFEATKNSKIKELLKLDGIYKIKDLIYNPYIIRELGVFYKEKFKEKLTSKEIKKLIKSNSDQVIEEMFTNYQNRTKGNKIIDAYYDFILFYTLGFNIKSFSNYNGNKDYDYTPVIWSKTFNNSIRLLENYETANRSSKLNLDNNKIIQELFEGVDNIPSLLNNFSIDQIPDEVFQEYLNEVVQTRDIPDDDTADIYE